MSDFSNMVTAVTIATAVAASAIFCTMLIVDHFTYRSSRIEARLRALEDDWYGVRGDALRDGREAEMEAYNPFEEGD
jgi:hypothetical protein